jgi:hypothetical protein
MRLPSTAPPPRAQRRRDPGHAASVSLWANRGAAFAADRHVAEAMEALRDVFPAPPKVTAGAARVVAAAAAPTTEAGRAE